MKREFLMVEWNIGLNNPNFANVHKSKKKTLLNSIGSFLSTTLMRKRDHSTIIPY